MKRDEMPMKDFDRTTEQMGKLRLPTVSALVLAVAMLGTVGVGTWGTAAAGAASSPSGVVTIGEDLTGFSSEPVTFDITKSHVGAVQDPWDMAIYDTLLRPTPANGYLPELATKATTRHSGADHPPIAQGRCVLRWDTPHGAGGRGRDHAQ